MPFTAGQEVWVNDNVHPQRPARITAPSLRGTWWRIVYTDGRYPSDDSVPERYLTPRVPLLPTPERYGPTPAEWEAQINASYD